MSNTSVQHPRPRTPGARLLRPAAARLLVPVLVLQLLLPMTGWAAVPNTDASATGGERHELAPGPNSQRQHRLAPGPNAHRQHRLGPGPNSHRQPRLAPSPNSRRHPRLDDLGRDDIGTDRSRAGAAARDPRTFEWTAPNGIVARVTTWADERAGVTSSAVMRSPDGEELKVEFLPVAKGGPAALIDGEILVSYTVTDDGRVSSVLVDDGFRAVKSVRKRKPERADDTAYGALVRALGERHSAAFLAQSTEALSALEREAVAPATLRFVIECSLGVVGYIASIGGLISGCSAAGVATLGSSCALAIFAHELAVASGVMACMK